jgi:pyrroloquinoline quinone (PQQ) biosynthesis protein C
VEANLADELGTPAPHVALFESFAAAAGAPEDVPATPATQSLLDSIRAAVSTDPVAALAMVAAYEVQAADIATSKSAGLRRHYGMGAEGTSFWDVHAELEAEHAGWSVQALDDLAADPAIVSSAASAAATGWWDFLSERDQLAPAGASC